MCVLVQCAALGVTINCFSFFLHDWSNAFQIPASRLILGMVLFGFICSAFAPFVGRFLDRYSARLIVVVALVGIALIHVLIGFASHGWQIILLYALLPDSWFAEYFIKPDLPVRLTARLRLCFNTFVIASWTIR